MEGLEGLRARGAGDLHGLVGWHGHSCSISRVACSAFRHPRPQKSRGRSMATPSCLRHCRCLLDDRWIVNCAMCRPGGGQVPNSPDNSPPCGIATRRSGPFSIGFPPEGCVNGIPGHPPGLVLKTSFESRETTLRCAHQVRDPVTRFAHQGEGLFGRDPAVHDPGPPRLAEVPADLLQKMDQRLAVLDVPGHDLAGEGESALADPENREIEDRGLTGQNRQRPDARVQNSLGG